MQPATRIALFTIGIFIIAWGFNAFLLHNNIITGGLPGLSLIMYMSHGIDPSISQWMISIPLFILSWICLGKNVTLHSLAGSMLLPLMIFLTRDFPGIEASPILAALFGGFTCGAGLGFVFRANSTVGGFSIIARIVAAHQGIPVGRVVLIIDAIIITCAGIIYGAEAAMLGLISVFAFGKAIDIIQTGVNMAKSISIITRRPDAMRTMLVDKLSCGVTTVQAEGAYSREPRTLMITVVPRGKVARLRRNVRQIDPDAFTIISDASEVLGYGFQHHG